MASSSNKIAPLKFHLLGLHVIPGLRFLDFEESLLEGGDSRVPFFQGLLHLFVGLQIARNLNT